MPKVPAQINSTPKPPYYLVESEHEVAAVADRKAHKSMCVKGKKKESGLGIRLLQSYEVK